MEASSTRNPPACCPHALKDSAPINPQAIHVLGIALSSVARLVLRHGHYFGGVIAPGINLGLDTLHRATAKLPRIAVEPPRQVIGKNTLGAMQSGIYWGYVGLIEGLTARIAAEFGSALFVVATGGLAPLFVGATPAIHHLDPEITMRGLVEIHRRNRRPGT